MAKQTRDLFPRPDHGNLSNPSPPKSSTSQGQQHSDPHQRHDAQIQPTAQDLLYESTYDASDGDPRSTSNQTHTSQTPISAPSSTKVSKTVEENSKLQGQVSQCKECARDSNHAERSAAVGQSQDQPDRMPSTGSRCTDDNLERQTEESQPKEKVNGAGNLDPLVSSRDSHKQPQKGLRGKRKPRVRLPSRSAHPGRSSEDVPSSSPSNAPTQSQESNMLKDRPDSHGQTREPAYPVAFSSGESEESPPPPKSKRLPLIGEPKTPGAQSSKTIDKGETKPQTKPFEREGAKTPLGKEKRVK